LAKSTTFHCSGADETKNSNGRGSRRAPRLLATRLTSPAELPTLGRSPPYLRNSWPLGLCGCVEYTRACPLSALGPPLVNYEKCVGCDLCTSACLFGAIRTGESRRTAVVILILIATTVAACRAVSISPFYQQQVGSIKFTAGMTYNVPKGAETPTGEGDPGAGFRF